MVSKKWLGFLVGILGVCATSLVYAADGGDAVRQRGFMFEIGLGPAVISYGAEADAYFAAAQAAGLSRVQVYLDITAGYAVTGKLYLVGGVQGGGDRFFDSTGAYVQLNSYLYHAGLRYYPFDTGLVLGLDAGPAALMATSNVGVSGASNWGWGGGATVAYDFAKKRTGFALVLGLQADYLDINAGRISMAALYLNVLWK